MNDLISRKALCDYALNQKDKSVTPNDIMRFPSAQPMQKKGTWKRRRSWKIYVCSECSFEQYSTSNFCPNCGADMRKEKEK